MSEILEKFRAAVGGYLEENGIIVDRSDIGNDIIIEAQGKIVQLRLIKNNIVISTIVYFNMMGDEYINSKVISEFNAFYLFNGGYRLMVEPKTLSIYVEESVNAKYCDSDSLSNKLYDFVKRSVSCTKWYIENVKEDSEFNTNSNKFFA